MGNKRATERLERAEQEARRVLKACGIERPTDGQLAAAILIVIEEKQKAGG